MAKDPRGSITMYHVIAEVLDAESVTAARTALANASFIDGRATAGWAARQVKNNLQAAGGDAALTVLREKITQKIRDNKLFQLAARPKTLTPLILSRYEPGMNVRALIDPA